MKTLNKTLIASIAEKAGLTPSEIRNASPGELRKHLTQKTGKQFTITSKFPWIGRGNVLRDKLMSSRDINKMVDKILR